MDNDYDIANEDGLDFPLGDDEVASCIDAVLAHEGVGRPCMVSVSVVSDERIREVNAEWRDVDAPTDVVSLECERPDDPDLAPGEPCELGDIILAPAYIAAQAARFGTTAADECRLLLVHIVVLCQLYRHFFHIDGMLIALVAEAAAHKLLCLFQVH